MQLLQKQDQGRKSSPVLALSDLELEILLEEGLEGIKEFYRQNPEHERKGSYFFGRDFSDKSREVKGKIPDSTYAENPAVIVNLREGSYTVQYNSQLDERINRKLERFKSRDNLPNADSFSRAIAREREWRKQRQLELVAYLCQEQKEYIESGNPKKLKRINQEDVAKHIGYSASTVSYITRNLTIQLPDGMVMYTRDLIPSNRIESSEGFIALQQLQQDTQYYDNILT